MKTALAMFALIMFAIVIISGVAAGAEPLVDEIQRILARGGNNWAVTQTAFPPNKMPGEVLYLWPAEPPMPAVITLRGGRGSCLVRLNWRLRPGAAFPEQPSEYLYYEWGTADGKWMGFQLVKVDRTQKSGTLALNPTFVKRQLAEVPGSQDIVIVVRHNAKDGLPLGNFLKFRLRFQE